MKPAVARPTLLDAPDPRSKDDAIVQRGAAISSRTLVVAARDWWWLILRTSVASAIPTLSGGILISTLPGANPSVSLFLLTIVWAGLIYVSYWKRQGAVTILADLDARLARLDDILKRAPPNVAAASE